MDTTSTPVDPGLAAQNISWLALLIIILVLSLATIIVGLRFYTRVVLLKQLGLDDYFVLLTLGFAVATGGAVLSTIPYGLGRRTATLDPSVIPLYLRSFWVSIVLYNATLMMIKLTFLIQYYRVLGVYKMKRVIWMTGLVIMMWAFSQLLVVIFSCSPVQKFWLADLEGQCMPNLPFWYINAAGNIVTDLAILILPLPVLAKLKLRRQQKYILIGIFCLGLFTCAISLIRLSYLKQGPDFTWDNVPTSGWSVSELCSGIICACLPTLRPLMSKIKPQWMVSYASRSRRTKQEYGDRNHYGANSGKIKAMSSSTGNSRSTRESKDPSLFVSSKELGSSNYTRLGDNDIEMAIPAPPSPSFQADRSRFDDARSSTDGENTFDAALAQGPRVDKKDIPMQSLSSRTKPQLVQSQGTDGIESRREFSNRGKENDKAMEILGVDQYDTGITTHIVADKGPSSMFPQHSRAVIKSKSGANLSGIEVKTDVIVSTTPSPVTRPKDVR
ncbi:hypothetical protein KVR01_006636 [Diaporthe batatas]|uniref:uncharacterized protein n=1 Tax=Diaporthe batatas TaxID=748121 RepID=UPI001D05ACDF|nr:uncharacterized protein KVR01_006636 [Diaporthe batatas]KAG8163339.1 hypothetical protein KVR01_006636 [Diaporthe batatas]